MADNRRVVDDAQFAVMQEQLARYLGPGRLAHSLNVAAAAADLSRLHAPEIEAAARIAGLLHDNAKGLADEELLANARRLDIELTAVESECPGLLHGKVGAALLPERFGVHDPEVAQAISDHVTGRVGMGKLSLVLFVADQVATDRGFPGVAELRRVSETDLLRAAYLVAKNKVLYTVKLERPLEPTTVAVYNELRSRIEQNGNR